MPLTIAASNETPRRGRGRPRKVKLRYLTADGRLQTWRQRSKAEPKSPETDSKKNGLVSFATYLTTLPLPPARKIALLEEYHDQLKEAALLLSIAIAMEKRNLGP